MNDEIKHEGSCHCGAIEFDVYGKIPRAMRCTCSICRKIGALWHGTTDEGMRIRKGLDEMSFYQFGTMTAKHYFCKNCGIHPFTRPRLDPSKWAVNIRCIANLDIESLTVVVFDGENWESAAAAFVARQRAASAA